MRGARPGLRVVENPPNGGFSEAGKPAGAEGFSTTDANCSDRAQFQPANLPVAEHAGLRDEPGSSRQIGDSKTKPANLPKVQGPDFPPPDDLPEEMRPEWQRVIADLQDRQQFTESMLGVVRAYLGACWSARQAEKLISEQGMFVPGAGGAAKPHPATGLLRSSRDMISRLAAELGLTPTSRARKSLQPGAGQRDLFASQWDL